MLLLNNVADDAVVSSGSDRGRISKSSFLTQELPALKRLSQAVPELRDTARIIVLSLNGDAGCEAVASLENTNNTLRLPAGPAQVCLFRSFQIAVRIRMFHVVRGSSGSRVKVVDFAHPLQARQC